MHLVTRLIDKAEAAETFRPSHEFYVSDVHTISDSRYANVCDPNPIAEPEVIMNGIMVLFVTCISLDTSSTWRKRLYNSTSAY
jgi:hypothetical protein